MASGSEKPELKEGENPDKSPDQDPSVDIDDEAPLLPESSDSDGKPTDQEPLTSRFRLADAFAQSHWENVISPSIGLNDPMKFVVPIVSPPQVKKMASGFSKPDLEEENPEEYLEQDQTVDIDDEAPLLPEGADLDCKPVASGYSKPDLKDENPEELMERDPLVDIDDKARLLPESSDLDGKPINEESSKPRFTLADASTQSFWENFMASGSFNPDLKKDENPEESLEQDQSVDIDDKAPLLPESPELDGKPVMTNEEPSTSMFSLGDAFVQSQMENVGSSSMGLNDPMKFVVPIPPPPKVKKVASGYSKPDLKKDENPEESLEQDPSVDIDDKATLLPESSDLDGKPIDEESSKPRFTLADASAQSFWENFMASGSFKPDLKMDENPNESLDQDPSVDIDDKAPLLPESTDSDGKPMASGFSKPDLEEENPEEYLEQDQLVDIDDEAPLLAESADLDCKKIDEESSKPRFTLADASVQSFWENVVASGSSKSDLKKDENPEESLEQDPSVDIDKAPLLPESSDLDGKPTEEPSTSMFRLADAFVQAQMENVASPSMGLNDTTKFVVPFPPPPPPKMRRTNEEPSTSMFKLAEASAQSQMENVASPSMFLNDPMKFVVPIPPPLPPRPPKVRRMQDLRKKKKEFGPKKRPASPTPSNAETAPHERRNRLTVTPALSDPVRALDWRLIPRNVASEPPPFEHAPSGNELENSSQYLGSDEPSPFHSMPNSSDEHPLVPAPSFMERYTKFSTRVVDSYFFIPVLLLLTGISVFACYMGIAYYFKCEFIPDITMLVIFQGCCMAIALIARIVYIVAKKHSNKFGDLRFVTIGGIFCFLIMYIIVFFYYNFHKGYPSTETGHTYCHPIFYNYLFWHNWGALLILVVMTLVHGPVCFNLKSLIDSL